MTSTDLFVLWGKVLKGDVAAKRSFIDLYKKRFPKQRMQVPLHTMYLHLMKPGGGIR